MDVIENLEVQAKESHRNMEKAIDKVTVLEKNAEDKCIEMEDIRERITKVAELFERKEIK
jgi:predicted DNA binding CopG/RHH family protein